MIRKSSLGWRHCRGQPALTLASRQLECTAGWQSCRCVHCRGNVPLIAAPAHAFPSKPRRATQRYPEQPRAHVEAPTRWNGKDLILRSRGCTIAESLGSVLCEPPSGFARPTGAECWLVPEGLMNRVASEAAGLDA